MNGHTCPPLPAIVGCHSCHRLWQEICELKRRITELESAGAGEPQKVADTPPALFDFAEGT